MRVLALLGLILGSALGCLRADDAIRFKTRDVYPSHTRRAALSARHLILRFNARPDARLVAELEHRGIRVLAYLPESSLMVAPRGELELRGLGVTWAGPMAAQDKMSPALEGVHRGPYLVMFHPDVEADVARGLAEDRGLQILENPGLLPNHLLVDGESEQVAALAASDEVAYILPARTELALRRRVYACPGALTPAGPVADYVLATTGWPKDASGAVALGYAFDNFPQTPDANTVRSQIERAFAEWARYTNVTFTEAQREAAERSIDILFASGAHGDAYPFVGTSILAHTFYPAPPNAETIAGDMHFNAAEIWQVGSGIDLFSVALHEAGHALGLGHSDDPDAVMYPYYKMATGLTSDDIAAVQALYGAPSSQPASPPSSPPAAPPSAPPATPPATPPANPPSGPSNPAGGSDTTPPSISITSPAGTIVSTLSATIAVSGSASDNVGVTVVTWSTSTGGSGIASGTTAWSASVPLLVGDNVVTVRAYDAAGNSGWRAITVVRQ
jgi:hypothetical protein